VTSHYQFVLTHFWESTLFGFACAVLIVVLEKSWSFSRHLLAWAGLVKFLVPLAALTSIFEIINIWLFYSVDPNDLVLPHITNLTEKLRIETWISIESISATQPVGLVPSISILGCLWIFGLITLLSFWVYQYQSVKSSINDHCQLADYEWQPLAQRIWEERYEAIPEILLCDNEGLVAGVFGFWRPVIVVPSEFREDFTSGEREAFLHHEFQHIYKHDNHWSFLQKFIRILFWFHPLAWWFDRQVSAEREIMRDEEVIKKTKNIPAYLGCLMKASNFDGLSNYAGSVSIKGSPFMRRIKAISRLKPTTTTDRLSAVMSISAICLFTLLISTTFTMSELKAHVYSNGLLLPSVTIEDAKIDTPYPVSTETEIDVFFDDLAYVESERKTEFNYLAVLKRQEAAIEEQFALSEYRQIKNSNPSAAIDLLIGKLNHHSSAALILTIGYHFYNQKAIGEAQKEFSALHEQFPKLQSAAKILGFIYMSINQWDKALANFHTSISLGDMDPVTFGRMAECYVALGDTENAEKWNRKAREIDPRVGAW